MGDEISFTMVRYMNSINRMILYQYLLFTYLCIIYYILVCR